MALRVGIIVLTALLVVGLLSLWMTFSIQPHDLTRSRMMAICARINLYSHTHGHPPTLLQQLPKRPEHNDSIEDGWGNAILYVYDADRGTITLRSYAGDGVAGGRGDNEDIEVRAKLDDEGLIPYEQLVE